MPLGSCEAVRRAFLDWKVDYGFGCSARFRWGFGAVKARGVELAVRAVGGVWSACEGFGGVVWGLMAVLWAGAEECC